MLLLESFNKPLAVFLSFSLFFFLVYSLVIFVSYAFSDSYSVLCAAMRHEISGEAYMQIAGGRPFNALLYTFVFTLMHGIDDLRYLRALSVIGIAALAAAVHRDLRRADLPWPRGPRATAADRNDAFFPGLCRLGGRKPLPMGRIAGCLGLQDQR
jgi:hypothetical protein